MSVTWSGEKRLIYPVPVPQPNFGIDSVKLTHEPHAYFTQNQPTNSLFSQCTHNSHHPNSSYKLCDDDKNITNELRAHKWNGVRTNPEIDTKPIFSLFVFLNGLFKSAFIVFYSLCFFPTQNLKFYVVVVGNAALLLHGDRAAVVVAIWWFCLFLTASSHLFDAQQNMIINRCEKNYEQNISALNEILRPSRRVIVCEAETQDQKLYGRSHT